ncbi:MAG: DNA-protecting protein DprA [Bacilli bacterium]|jgi:DNA processing protein|nr:DNA-protecting protein DprA [Bacilli bacterium]
MDTTVRDVLLMLSNRFHGDWNSIYQAIKEKTPFTPDEIKAAYAKTTTNFFTLTDQEYPEAFKNQCNPPFVLYYYGNIELLKEPYLLTSIGTRSPTLYQSDMVYKLIRETEKELDNKVVVISGMAKGLDAISMKAAMSTHAPVISIIGSGIDNPYPSENKDIYEYCKNDNGLVLSEYPGGAEAKPDNFIFRNRMLAALGNVIFIGGGRNKSGTSASVRLALDCNKEILALPCNVTGDDLTNELIQDGARSVLSAKDLIDVLSGEKPR